MGSEPHRERQERRLLAIFAADVAGYSKLMRADEQGTLRALQSDREIIDSRPSASRPTAWRLIPTRMKADSLRGFQTGASQTPWRRTGGSPCGQGLHFVRTMMQPSFGL